MAKKTTSTAAKKKEQQERLNQGGQNIANIAQNIVAKRQEQAVNKVGQQYGIRKTAGDMLATRALGIIQDREALSYRKRLEEEERRRREAEAARQQNMAGNLRSAAQRVNIGGMTGSPTQSKLKKSALETIMEGLGAKIENEQNIINNQGRAEDDPARIRADKELKELEKRRTETQEKIASIPGPQAGNAASIGMSRYTPDEEAYIRRLQGKLEKGQSKKQTIPAVWNQDLKYIQHMRNTPESTEGEDYIKWLQEGADIGLYDKKVANAMIAQAGNSDDPLAQYMALTPEQKSGWLRNSGEEVNRIMTMRAAREYNQAHPYTTDRDELLAKQEYYTGLRDEAQSALDRMNGNIRIMYTPDGMEPVEIRGRSNPYYQQNPDAINEQFYDALVGQGEYRKRKAEFTDDPEGWEKADQLELQLTEAWDAYEQGRWNDAYRILTGKNNYAEMESQLGYANDNLNTIQGQLNRYNQYDEFMGGYAGAQRAGYDPEKDRGFDSLVDYGTRNNPNHRPAYRDPNTKDVHRVYSFINQGKEYKAYYGQKAHNWDENEAKIEAVYGKAALMLPEEIEIFNGYYNAGKYQEASAFFNGLSMALNDRYSQYEEIENREQARKYPVLSSFATLASEQLSGALAIPRTFAGFAGEKSVYDPNSAWYASTRFTEQTQDEIANMIGGEGGKFYLQGMNTLRNMTNAAMVALAGVPASGQAAAGLAMFAAQIYQDQTFKHLKETNDYGKAVGLATLDAALETMEEMLPYETMLQGGGNVFLSWLANSVSEAAEEFTGATLGDAIKGLITGRQEWEARRDKIFNEGGYTDEDGTWVALDTSDSDKALVEAQTQAWKEKGHEIIENTVAGFVGGGLGAGYGIAREGIYTRNTGVKVNSKEGGFNTLLEAARGMDENSATRKLAEELYAKQQKGKNISNYQTGKLAQTMYQESGQEIRDTIEGAMTRKVESELKAEGASDEYAEQAAPIIAQTVTTGKNLRKADIRVIAKEDAGVILMESYMTGDRDAAESIKQAGGEAAMNAQQAVRDVLGEKPAKAKRGPATEGLREFAPIAKQSDLDSAEGPRHDNGLDAVVDGHIVSIKGRSGDNYTVIDENNEEHTVNKKDVQAADESLGLLMEYADRNRDIVDDEAFRELAVGLKNNQGMNLDDYLEQSTRAIINFRTGGTVRNSRLATGTLNALKTVAQRQNDRWDEERIKKAGKQRKATPGKGLVTYNGIQAGTDEWEAMAKKAGPILGGQLRLIGEIGVRLGNEIEIVEREDMQDAFGWEDPDTGKIYVNLAAENVKGQAGNRHVLTVTAHELTHWLEQNSPEEYKALRDFVFSTLRKNGTNIANRVIERIDNFQGLMKRDMTVNEAMAEIVADACDQVLTNEQVARQLEAESPNLYQKIKSFVKNFIETVRSYAGHIDTSEESRKMIKAGQETLDELARIWLGARQEALGRQEGNTEAQEAGNGAQMDLQKTIQADQRKYNGKELYRDSEVYDRNFLISLHPVLEIQEGKISDVEDENGNIDDKKLEDKGIENAIKEAGGKAKGNSVIVINEYTGRPLVITRNGIDHSVHTDNNSTNRSNARIAQKAGLLAKHGVPINGLKNEVNIKGTYAIAAPVLGEDGKMEKVAILTIEVRTGNLVDIDVYDQLHAASGRKKNEARKTRSVRSNGLSTNTHSFRISIAEFLDEINSTHRGILSTNVLNFYEEERPMNGYWGPRALFSTRQDETYTRLLEEETAARDVERELRDKYRELTNSDEIINLQEKIHNAEDRETRRELMKEYKDWEARNNISELKDQMYDAAQKAREARKAVEDYYNQMAEAEEQEKIEKSGLTEAEWRRKEAVKQFGYTTNFREAGYLLPNGKMLNFSGEKGLHAGHRGEDHRGIGIVYATKQGTDAMNAFMADGNIRVMAETPGIDMVSTVEPTAEQYAMIRRMAEQFAREEYFNVDFSDERGYNVGTIEYDGRVNGQKIVNDIKSFYKTGEVPQQSVVSQFHYSIRNISEEDRAYADAVARGDIQAATDMLMEKLSHAENIIPFNAPEWYAGRHKDIAKQIKQLAVEGTLDEIRESIEKMASFVPDNAVLVPMPNHHGEVNADTDTMILSNVLSEMTGRPVVAALAGDDRESRYKSKEKGGKGIQAEAMGFRQVQEIPEGTIPVFIDNVVGSGVTAQAARDAMGGGITLAYAKSVRSKGIPGLKRATITYDKNGNLIPLSQRFNPDVRNINYSIRELDSQYMQAEKTGNAAAMEAVVKEAAKRAGFDTSRFAYHGTEYFGYTEFDMPNMQNEIFVAYNPIMSATYTNRGQVKNISDRLNIPNWRNMEPEELAEFAKDALKTMNGDPITSIKYLKHGENSLPESPMMQEFGVSIASSIPWYPSYMKFRRFELNALLMNLLSPNGEAEGIYRLYTRPGRQLVINAHGANWNEIGINNPELAEGIRAYYNGENALTGAYTTRQISQYAKQAGYDSVLIEDVFDDGMKNPTVDRSEYGRIGGDIAIFFNPNDVKSADTITYDDDGNIIPPSERFRDESNDLRFSMREPELEVNRWMMGLSESSLRTTQERMLWKQYKEVNGSWELTKRFIRELTEQMRKLEAKENKTAMDTFDIQKLQGQIEKWEEKRNEYEEQILKVTSDKGYAAIMYRERNKMENLLNGRTEDEVRQTIDAMQAELDTVEKEMAARNAKLKELSERENVKLIRNQLNSAGLRRIAAKLKNDLGSELQNKEIENRLALLALKMKQGKVDSTEIMELADMLVGSMKPAYDDYVLSELRGMTIGLNSSEQETLKNRGMNIRDLQRELTGTGIRVVAGGPNTIDKNWDELLVSFPTLDPAANPGDMLWGPDADHKGLMDLVEDAIRQQKAMGPDSDQVAAMVLEAASDLVPEILTDAKSMKLIRESMEFIAEINQSTEALDNMEDLFNRLRKKNANTKATLGKLENKIVDAIEYTNELAKQHDVTAWKHERRVIIDQLKDKHTKEILEIQTKYREKIAKDKKARDLMGDNNALRREIHRNISKYRRLIVNETDRENVPEAYKPLAREMLMKLIRHDLAADRKITVIDEERLADAFHFLSGMNARDGKFGLEDLNMLPEDIREEVADALANIEDGIRQYDADPKGKDIIENLKTYKDGLEQVAEAVNLITNVINKARSISYMDRERRLDDEAARVIRDMRRIKKELAGRGSKSANAVKRSVFYGNMTPVYFFKNLKNAGISDQWEEFEAAENKNGLELTKAKAFFDKVAEDCHYKSWDLDKEFTVKFNGFPVKITTEQIMALYATWQREKMIGPEESHHLETGGVILEDSGKDKGKPRMERKQQKARKVKDGDMAAILQLLTNEQKVYVHKVVGYLSKEMSDLGNEASMRMYGIKKYNEKWYFPFKVWDGVLSARSDKGITGKDENRAAHKGWSKRRKNNAGNALVIGNFTDTAVKHVVEMINYNTFAPAIENLNKIMNYQTVEVDQNQEEERRNIRVMFQEAYGTEALRYMEDWMRDLQGGVTQDQRKTLRDRLISMFKKNAVAGSLSVTLQQPLSYIRAAMMINPKYLAGALSPQYWKGSYREMLNHSGVAVIKQMGRFDMNFGQSAQDWIMPKAKQNAYEKISDVLTAAPQAADTMTWTRMWSAVKMEQHAAHPDMDIQSEEFLDLVGKRFNEVMRRTQVYDSTLTKSSNMRSQALSMKLITSFMAEPTLSLNVLADAVANVKEKGGKATLAKAGATYLLSAVLQAAVKGFMGAGRSPDEKKTAAENVLNKFLSNLLSEANPASLIPGYSDMVEVLKNGELKDDALGVLGKLKSIYTTATNIMNPDKSKGPWRDVEDTLGQFVQLFSNIPLKNLMRDTRAMYNWATGSKFADRPTSGAVVKYQGQETLVNGDNLLGVINSWLGDAGFKTSNKAYYGRMYNAMAGGNQGEADDIREYLELAKGQGKDKIESGLRTAARDDNSKTPAEQSQWMIDNDLLDGTSSITTQYKKGEITREEAEGLYKAASPKMTGNDIFWKLDQMDYEKETGETETGYYYRLRDAITKNKADEIQAAVKTLLAHGITKEKIKDKLSDWKAEYTAGDSAKKIQIRDAITKAYKAAGYTAEDANKTIERWNKEAKKAEPEKKDAKDTTGRWGRGNIDLNNRKVVENDDGAISTERSFSVNIDGKEVLLPTVIDGKIVSEEEAIRHYEQTGQYLGKFNTVKEAEEYAEKLHNRQDWYYNQ